jgi:hypothetical protein
MHDNNVHRRHQQSLHAVALSTTRQRLRSETGHRLRPPRAGHGRWVLVQVCDGAALAAFDDEPSARDAMRCADDDEVVVLYVKA